MKRVSSYLNFSSTQHTSLNLHQPTQVPEQQPQHQQICSLMHLKVSCGSEAGRSYNLFIQVLVDQAVIEVDGVTVHRFPQCY